MTIRCLGAFGCLLTLVPGACFGQGAAKSFAPGETAKGKGVEEQIVKMTEDVLAAEVREDIPAVDRLLTDSYTHTHAAGKIQSRAEFLADFSPGSHKYKGADISKLQVRFFGASAIISGNEHILVDGPNGDHYYTFAAFWVQQQGQWKMAAWITSTDPKNLRVPAGN